VICKKEKFIIISMFLLRKKLIFKEFVIRELFFMVSRYLHVIR